MKQVLSKSFFEEPTLQVTRQLLGKYLVRRVGRKTISGMITEVEAYDGPRDRASHASRGRTKRNAPMFGPAGHWYVYFTYGMHWMLNIVTGRVGYPAAILIRGVATYTDTCGLKNELPRMINGPARVTKFFKIDERFNNKKAVPKGGLWIEDRSARKASRSDADGGITKFKILRAPRIGVDYAGPVWTKRRWRFFIEKNENGGWSPPFSTRCRINRKAGRFGTALATVSGARILYSAPREYRRWSSRWAHGSKGSALR